MIIAVIPARGGSRRIPRKNVRPFCGKPMIAWSIEAAKVSGLFDHIIVSTDDPEIREVAEAWGAQVPFMRPPELADDRASTDRVLVHALQEIQGRFGSVTRACCVYPTGPFLTTRDLEFGLGMLQEHQATSAFPVVRYDFPIEQALLLEGATPRAVWPSKLDENSQDLSDYYHDAGMFYWFAVDKFLQERRLFCADSVAFVIPADRCQDINTAEDWARAEIKFRIMRERERG